MYENTEVILINILVQVLLCVNSRPHRCTQEPTDKTEISFYDTKIIDLWKSITYENEERITPFKVCETREECSFAYNYTLEIIPHIEADEEIRLSIGDLWRLSSLKTNEHPSDSPITTKLTSIIQSNRKTIALCFRARVLKFGGTLINTSVSCFDGNYRETGSVSGNFQITMPILSNGYADGFWNICSEPIPSRSTPRFGYIEGMNILYDHDLFIQNYSSQSTRQCAEDILTHHNRSVAIWNQFTKICCIIELHDSKLVSSISQNTTHTFYDQLYDDSDTVILYKIEMNEAYPKLKSTHFSGDITVEETNEDQNCSWIGHCYNDQCATDEDCVDSLICFKNQCDYQTAVETTQFSNIDCTWEAHCPGSYCFSDYDCNEGLNCVNQRCSNQNSYLNTFMVTTSKPCTMENRCEGAYCYSDYDCDDYFFCIDNYCRNIDRQ